jgi:hypothetical protein
MLTKTMMIRKRGNAMKIIKATNNDEFKMVKIINSK